MSRYLLSCECGEKLPVDVGQAGGTIVCSCGKSLDVPTLRRLRHLPAESPRATANVSGSAWGLRQQAVTICLIAALALIGAGAWSWLTEPAVPQLDLVAAQQNFNQTLEDLTPADGWRMWVGMYQPLAERGFDVYQHPAVQAVEQQIARRRVFQAVMLGLAAAAGGAAAIIAFSPGGKNGR